MCFCHFSILNLLELPPTLHFPPKMTRLVQQLPKLPHHRSLSRGGKQWLFLPYWLFTEYKTFSKPPPIPSPDIWLLMSHVWIRVFLEQAREMDLQCQCSLLRLGRPTKHTGPTYLSLLGFCECGSLGKWEGNRLPTVSAIASLLVLNHFSNLSVSLRSDSLWHHIRITWWTKNSLKGVVMTDRSKTHILLIPHSWLMGFPGGASGKEPACQCRRHKRHGFEPWVGKIPWRRAWQPTPVFLPGESHEQGNLADYSP